MKNILVIHGPNLNLLGTREPEVYGSQTLDDINQHLSEVAAELGATVRCVQNNIEGELVNAIHAARGTVDAIIINPAAYTHTSVALRDALAGVAIPFVEVHLSNVYQRESFRHHSFFSEIAIGVISGLGAYGYEAALRFLVKP
ncbi:MAG: type II 3-dehydroquinate dehydratase [Formosimonas sp.]|jgi:3-dehydroquinate dehydratase-2